MPTGMCWRERTDLLLVGRASLRRARSLSRLCVKDVLVLGEDGLLNEFALVGLDGSIVGHEFVVDCQTKGRVE